MRWAMPGVWAAAARFLHHEGQLEPQQLVECQAAPGKLPFLEVRRGVDPPECCRATGEVEVPDEPPRQHLGQVPGALERLGDIGSDFNRADLGLARLGVDGDDAARLVTYEVHDGVGHLACPAVDLGAPEDDDLGALRQLACPPGLVEKDDGESSGGVFDHNLHHCPAAPQAAGGDSPHRRADHRLLVLDKGRDLGLMAAVDVAPRVTHQQVQDGLDAHRLEAGGLSRLDRPQLAYVLSLEEPQRAASSRLAHSTETR